MNEYQGYTIGDIINENWEILNIERKEKSGRNRIMFTVRCIHCRYIDENEVYMILKRKSCKHCRQNELQSMVGFRQGRLQILEISDEKHSNGSTQFICKCDCGNIFTTTYSSIKRGTSSCGCLKNEPTTLRHGMTGTRIHRIWKNTKNVCNSVTSSHYINYGSKGVRICPEWNDSFETFYEWAMNNGYNDTLYLTRYNRDADFCPENCYWATREQLNYSMSTEFINYYGLKTLTQMSEILCEPYSVIQYHYYNGTIYDFIRQKTIEFGNEFYHQIQINK